jgi:hypothetical protein
VSFNRYPGKAWPKHLRASSKRPAVDLRYLEAGARRLPATVAQRGAADALDGPAGGMMPDASKGGPSLSSVGRSSVTGKQPLPLASPRLWSLWEASPR